MKKGQKQFSVSKLPYFTVIMKIMLMRQLKSFELEMEYFRGFSVYLWQGASDF